MRRLGAVIALTAGVACQGRGPAPVAAPVAPAAPAATEELPTERLRRGMAGAAAAPEAARNPFRFGGGPLARRPGASPPPPLPAADELPELPLPLAAPPLKLLGVATETGGARVAMLLVGGDLVLARPGEVLAARYRVVAVAEEAVDLVDAVGDRPLRIVLP